ncbi:SAC3/GANP/Nin1/mts3/eIF-3 p25 family-domain-containing protein [Cunninghamella echinulata]|nr:SAC3/GANP/Nin1/mts3/eIF-3 p25 family-domain-containing protein [Cunninghamella echinulata]
MQFNNNLLNMNADNNNSPFKMTSTRGRGKNNNLRGGGPYATRGRKGNQNINRGGNNSSGFTSQRGGYNSPFINSRFTNNNDNSDNNNNNNMNINSVFGNINSTGQMNPIRNLGANNNMNNNNNMFNNNSNTSVFHNNSHIQHNNNNNNNNNKPWKRSTRRLPEVLGGNNNNTNNILTTSKIENSIEDHEYDTINTQQSSQATKADRAARFGSTTKTALYDEMKQKRIEERKRAIQRGLIPDPNAPTRLEDAIDFRGTCTSMCPEFEMVERELQNGLDSLEMDEDGNLDPEKAVKTYRRSAAGNEQPLPSDVRTPDALIRTLDYLMNSILGQYPLEKCHPFIRDRTRSIRQDFTLQNIRDQKAVEAHERIARFHILCLHEMCHLDEEKFSEQQETEQLRKVLISLMEFYDDLREEGIEMENEAEFRAYNLISHVRDPDAARNLQTLPKHVFLHPNIQLAIQFYGLMQRNNEIMETSSRRNKPVNVEASQNFYSQFFKLVKDDQTPFLMACMLEWHFPDVRKGALKAMNTAYRHARINAEYVREVLAYDTIDLLLEELQLYGLKVDDSSGEPIIMFGQRRYNANQPFFIEPLSNPKQHQSILLIESKKGELELKDIVNDPQTCSATTITRRMKSNNKRIMFTPNNRITNTSIPAFKEPLPLSADYIQRREKVEMKQAKEHRVHDRDVLVKNLQQRRKELDDEVLLEQMKIQKRQEYLELKKKEQEEQERLKKEHEQQALMEKRLKEEKEKAIKQKILEEEARVKREKEQREMELQRQRKAAIVSQAKKRYTKQLVSSIMQEIMDNAIVEFHRKQAIAKKYTRPWLLRVRKRIQARHQLASKRLQHLSFSKNIVSGNSLIEHFSQNVMITPRNRYIRYNNNIINNEECVKQRTDLSLEFESSALKFNQTNEINDAWRSENYGEKIHQLVRTKWDRIRSRLLEDNEKPGWQLWISVANQDLLSSKWFNNKFGLDEAFLRNVSYFNDCRITIRSVSNQFNMYGKSMNWVQLFFLYQTFEKMIVMI